MDISTLSFKEQDTSEFYALSQYDWESASHKFLKVTGKNIGKLDYGFNSECLADSTDKIFLILNVYRLMHEKGCNIYRIPVNGASAKLSESEIEDLRLRAEGITTQPMVETPSSFAEHLEQPKVLTFNLVENPEFVSAESLKQHPVFNQLAAIHPSKEGNLLENIIDVDTRDAQISFFRYAFKCLKLNQINRGHLLETGTNKGFFGFIASQFFGPTVLHTFDLNPNASKCVPILASLGMDVIFTCGDSTKVLESYSTPKPVIFTWVDGGHRYEEALADLNNAARLRSKVIAIDDMKFFRGAVDTAFHDFLQNHPEYKMLENPFWDKDQVGIAWCVRLDD